MADSYVTVRTPKLDPAVEMALDSDKKYMGSYPESCALRGYYCDVTRLDYRMLDA